MADLKKLHAEALDRFKLCAFADKDQRTQEQADLKFRLDQWPAEAKAARQAGTAAAGTPALPPRPMLTLSQLDAPINQIVNQARNADLTVKFAPRHGAATRETADAFEGLNRAIDVDSQSHDPRIWAFQRCVECGRGFYRIDKCYATDEGDTQDPAFYDMALKVCRIQNQAGVYMDPFAENAEWRDARFGFITQDIPESVYKTQFGESKLATADTSETLTAIGDHKDDWILDDGGGNRSYRIAEYWYVIESESKTKGPNGAERVKTTRTVYWAKINGLEFLEPPQEWDGCYIPIIPVLGNEFNINGKRIYTGVIRGVRDPQIMLNFMVSSAAEQINTATKAPYLLADGQKEGFEAQWDQSNQRFFPALEYNRYDDAGRDLGVPQRNIAEPPIQAIMGTIGMFGNFIKSGTGVPDPSLGVFNPNDRSGKAIAALQQASEQGTSGYIDHFKRAIEFEGEIKLDLIPKVYDRPGRVASIIGADGDEDAVMLGQPFIASKDGPQPLQPGQPPPQNAPVKHIDLSKGRYSVAVNVGKSFTTKRQEGFAAIGSLIEAQPALAPIIGPLWLEDADFPGAPKIAAIMKKMWPPQLQDQNAEVPPQAQALIQQGHQLLQAAQQKIAQLEQEKQADVVKSQFRLQETQIEANNRLEIARENNKAAFLRTLVGQVGALSATDAKVDAENTRSSVDALMTAAEQAVGAHGQRLDHAHERIVQQADHLHEHAMQANEHAHAKDLADSMRQTLDSGQGQAQDSGQSA